MKTVLINKFNKPQAFSSDGNNTDYYLRLITRETTSCLNANGINYYVNIGEEGKEILSDENFDIDVKLEFKTSSTPGPLPGDPIGIYIFFNPGNPESKRLAEIFQSDIENIYPYPTDVKIIADNNIENNTVPNIVISFGYAENPEDIAWLRDNIDLVANSIVLSLCKYFAIPFIGCSKAFFGIANSDATIYERPSLNSKVIGSIEKNSNVKIQNQWENWYVVGENLDLGYTQTQFINVIEQS